MQTDRETIEFVIEVLSKYDKMKYMLYALGDYRVTTYLMEYAPAGFDMDVLLERLKIMMENME